eukprot:4655276-Alexandrium_andersonii.AAC.1
MSASLVGSEMCIRDRLKPPAAADVALAASSFPARAATCGDGWHPSFGPVSYTHLTLPTICSV